MDVVDSYSIRIGKEMDSGVMERVVPEITNIDNWKPYIPPVLTSDRILPFCNEVTSEKIAWIEKKAVSLEAYIHNVIKSGYRALLIGEEHHRPEMHEAEAEILEVTCKKPEIKSIRLMMEIGSEHQKSVTKFMYDDTMTIEELEKLCPIIDSGTKKKTTAQLFPPVLETARKYRGKVEVVCVSGHDMNHKVSTGINNTPDDELAILIAGKMHTSKQTYSSIPWKKLTKPTTNLNLVSFNIYDNVVMKSFKKSGTPQGIKAVIPIFGSPFEQDPALFVYDLKKGNPIEIMFNSSGPKIFHHFLANEQHDANLIIP